MTQVQQLVLEWLKESPAEIRNPRSTKRPERAPKRSYSSFTSSQLHPQKQYVNLIAAWVFYECH
jgi:hypothetical protein